MAMAETSFSINGTCSVKEQTHNIDHSSDLLQFANKSRQDRRFNDIIIRMEEKHKDVVELHDLDAESVEKLVDFMYTGKININTNNVCDLLAVSDFLKIHSVKKLCIAYLLTTVSLQNCFTIQALADCFTIPELTEKFNKFVVENYQQVVSDDQFKKLSKDDVIKLFQSTHGKVSSDLVYTAVMNWVKFDLASNESYLSQLLKFVDFYGLSPKMLEDVVSVEPLIRKLRGTDCSFQDALVEHAKKTEKSLISLGGLETPTKVTKFDLRTKQWSQLPDLPVGRDIAAAVVIDDVLYFIAGNLRTDGTIFVFGGSDDNYGSLSSGESYVVSLNKWIQLKPMKIKRYGHCLRTMVGYCNIFLFYFT
ncbi:kelch-like protein 12 [Ciona intestinalis]